MTLKRNLEPKEADIQKVCLAFLEKAGFMAWRNHTQGTVIRGKLYKSSKKGSADVFALKDGIFYAIEFKTPSGKLEPEQLEWLQRAAQHGAKTFVIRSLDELIEVLQAHGELKGFLFPTKASESSV